MNISATRVNSESTYNTSTQQTSFTGNSFAALLQGKESSVQTWDIANKSVGTVRTEPDLTIPDGYDLDTEEGRQAYFEDFCHVVSLTVPTEPVTQLRDLTEEEIIDLNSRYDLENMEESSVKYYKLMEELVDMGVISGMPSSVPMDTISMTVDENGMVTSYLQKTDGLPTSKNVNTFFSASLSASMSRFFSPDPESDNGINSHPENHDLANQVFRIQYESYKTLQNIFGALSS
ncbi:MAG: hypothetical protein R3Y53_10375 [Bacillota bacterium]